MPWASADGMSNPSRNWDRSTRRGQQCLRAYNSDPGTTVQSPFNVSKPTQPRSLTTLVISTILKLLPQTQSTAIGL